MAQQAMALATRLQFTDSASCAHWIQSLPMTNPQAAHNVLSQQIPLVRQAGLAPPELLRVLELLREPVAYVQYELARKYTARALPLEPAESELWTRAVALWQELMDCYLLCRDAQADPGLARHGPLIMMRSLHYLSCAMFEHYRIYRQAPAELWKKLHQLYRAAEQGGIALAAVIDTHGEPVPNASCAAAYCKALLALLANPFALSGRQLEFLAQWLEKWSGLVGLANQPLPPSAIPALAVDLEGNAGAVFAEGLAPQAGLRHLDLEPLGRALRQTITLLKQGQTPAQLGLGDDARQPGCENLLMLLYIQWCRAGTGRTEQRNPSEEKAQVCLGMHAAHFYISGRAFRTPGSALTRHESHDIELFGHISERTEQMLATRQSSAVESWQLLNQSNSGFMCMLREPDAQMRIGHNQLVAVRRSTGRTFYLGLVQWLRVEETSELFVGVRLFPGVARAVAVRPANLRGAAADTWERALLLPELPAPMTSATIILPNAWFQAGRQIDLGDQNQIVKLDSLLEKGSDFDRCTYSLVEKTG